MNPEVKSISPATADSRHHPSWPGWKKAAAYALLSSLSAAAIWFVDVKVHRTAVMPRAKAPAAEHDGSKP